MTRQILTILGARPQFIKAAAVSRALAEKCQLEEIIVHTGQHYSDNMSCIFFDELALKEPAINLGVGSKSHGAQTGEMLAAIEALLLSYKPAMMLVYGDTNSTLAGALAAAKLHIPIAHVEAGLRSFNRKMPEEINRVLTDHVSDLLFCPTETAMKNAREEGISQDKLFLVGDVMYDAARYYSALAEERKQLLSTLNLLPKQYILATIHRAENTDNPKVLKQLFFELNEVAKQFTVILPLHPRTRKALEMHDLWDLAMQHIQCIEPLGFLDMLALEKQANLIITDSGGVQKEAFFNKVFCITVRDQTEWIELITHGWNTLVPSREISTLLDKVHDYYGAKGQDIQLYGDGFASQAIANICLNHVAN